MPKRHRQPKRDRRTSKGGSRATVDANRGSYSVPLADVLAAVMRMTLQPFAQNPSSKPPVPREGRFLRRRAPRGEERTERERVESASDSIIVELQLWVFLGFVVLLILLIASVPYAVHRCQDLSQNVELAFTSKRPEALARAEATYREACGGSPFDVWGHAISAAVGHIDL